LIFEELSVLITESFFCAVSGRLRAMLARAECGAGGGDARIGAGGLRPASDIPLPARRPSDREVPLRGP